MLFSGGRDDQINRIWIADAPAPGGPTPERRSAIASPGGMVVLDVAGDGTLLTASDNRRYHVGAKLRRHRANRICRGMRRLERVDLSTGARKLVREVRAPDLDSRRLTIRTASADGDQFAYSGIHRERTLYTVKGVTSVR